MSNFRVFYACESVSIGPEAATSGQYLPVHGLQSVSTNTTFNLEYVFELGQLDVYAALENLPNVEMTVEKALDGYPLIYHLATTQATSATLHARSIPKCDVRLSIFSDAQDSASGVQLTEVYTSGMLVNTINYTLPLNGFCKEAITLVGNDRAWQTSSFLFTGQFNDQDAPASGILRRNNVVMGNAGGGGSVWPAIIPGMTVVNGSGYNVLDGNGQYGAHYQDASVTCNLSRENLLELGRFKPYYRFARFPVAVDCTLNTLAAGATPGDLINASSNLGDITAQPIVINLSDGTVFDLGTKNRLISTTHSGGDTGGNPMTIAYNFQNYNNLRVVQPNDPSHLS